MVRAELTSFENRRIEESKRSEMRRAEIWNQETTRHLTRKAEEKERDSRYFKAGN